MKRNRSVIKHSVLALGVCASLVAGTLAFSGSAEARMSGRELGGLAAYCWQLQNRYDGYKWLRDHSTTLEGKNYYQGKMDETEADWDHDCRDRFGSIRMIVKPPAVIADAQPLTPAGGATTPLVPGNVPQLDSVDGGASIN